MRITNKTLVNTFLSNLNTNLQKMSKYQNQMSSGKNFSRPSDDPYGVTRSMELNSTIDRNNQYLRNIDDSIGWLNTTDTALDQVNSALIRIRDLMINSANGTKTDTEFQANKAEILQKIEEIAQVGNTVFDGKYIFGGNNTTDIPFQIKENTGEIDYSNADDGPINREIARGVTVEINITASDIMKYKDKPDTDPESEVDLSETLESVKKALSDGDIDALSGDLLGKITAHSDNVLRCRGIVGAKVNRMESAKEKNEEETFNSTQILSGIEDIDLAEKVMEYKIMENVYQASLMTNAKILQPSLIDFLR